MTGGMFTSTLDSPDMYVFLMFWFQTPLHYAAANGKGDIVEILVRNGANINEKDVKIIFVGESDELEKAWERRKEEKEGERDFQFYSM